jgi:hypothetical protein
MIGRRHTGPLAEIAKTALMTQQQHSNVSYLKTQQVTSTPLILETD